MHTLISVVPVASHARICGVLGPCVLVVRDTKPLFYGKFYLYMCMNIFNEHVPFCSIKRIRKRIGVKN